MFITGKFLHIYNQSVFDEETGIMDKCNQQHRQKKQGLISLRYARKAHEMKHG